MKRTVISYLIYTAFLFLVFYLFLPFINLHSVGFYFYLVLVFGFIFSIIVYAIKDRLIQKDYAKNKKYFTFKFNKSIGQFVRKQTDLAKKYQIKNTIFRLTGLVLLVVIAFITILGIFGSKLFSAERYYKQLEIKSSPITEYEEIFDFDDGSVALPVIDKELAFKLAQAKLSIYGAQYQIDYENFTLISVTRNAKDELLRIAPLEYSNLFVSLSRLNKGTIGYVEVNVITKEAKLVEISEGLKYMPTAKFSKDLDRHIRFAYPTVMYEQKYFEIDDEGNPYWVIPTITKEIALINGKNTKGLFLVNPINGEIKKYNIGEEPKWVDRVVVDTLVEIQATNALRYKHGYFNAVLGQKKEVFQVSDGYNYFIKDGHTYYVSCVTSPNEADQTSIGFLTIDLKNKDATMYSIPGITEMRAREIAMQKEEVKAQNLEATWPILINFNGVPTYFLVLKNEVQDQRIVFINVENGSIIAMEDSMQKAKESYKELLLNSGQTETEKHTLTGNVSEFRVYNNEIYFTISGTDGYFIVDFDLNKDTIFINLNDNVTFTYIISSKDGKNYNSVIEFKKNS